MKLWLTPEIFNVTAIAFSEYRWKLLAWSFAAFLLFAILELQVVSTTPSSLIWLIILILFTALQALVLAAFIFFFQELPSNKTPDKHWSRFYRVIEWCETLLFSFILPLPLLLFIYAFIVV